VLGQERQRAVEVELLSDGGLIRQGGKAAGCTDEAARVARGRERRCVRLHPIFSSRGSSACSRASVCF